MIDWGKCPPVECMLIMFDRTRMKLVPFALAATGLVVLCLAGCRKDEAKPETPASSPASYMKDKAFRKGLKAAREEWAELGEALERVGREMRAIEAAKGAAAKDDPEWLSLKARRDDLEQAIKENRAKALKAARDRLTPVRKEGSR